MQQQLLVNKNNLSDCHWQETDVPSANGPGDVVLRIDEFALTANNITYAVAGESMQYWSFFPTEPGYGRVPVWGFGHAIESNHPDIAVGDRFYGYFPIGSHLLVQAENVNNHGFVDASTHRASLAKVYNQYSRAGEPNTTADAAEMLFRPLYMTSFMLADFFANQQYFDAKTMVLTSASSKTSLGLAFLLHQRGDVQVAGLTSPKNKDFVSSLGCYDEVLEYDQLEQLDDSTPTALVDMAGNGDVLARLHNHLDNQLQYSCLVGATHWDARAGAREMAGPKPELFFAPAHIEARSKELGPGQLQALFQTAWDDFLAQAQNWISVNRLQGPEATARYYLDLLDDAVTPAEGTILAV